MEEQQVHKAIELPAKVQEEIQVLYKTVTDLQELLKTITEDEEKFRYEMAVKQAQSAFLQFLNTAKVMLGITETGEWDLTNDATHFFKITPEKVDGQLGVTSAQFETKEEPAAKNNDGEDDGA